MIIREFLDKERVDEGLKEVLPSMFRVADEEIFKLPLSVKFWRTNTPLRVTEKMSIRRMRGNKKWEKDTIIRDEDDGGRVSDPCISNALKVVSRRSSEAGKGWGGRRGRGLGGRRGGGYRRSQIRGRWSR